MDGEDMRVLQKAKDGGPDSNATGYFVIEIKWLFSIVFLRFEGESRTNYHTHAFNAWTWFISGSLVETLWDGGWVVRYKRHLIPKLTRRTDLHRVNSNGVSWVLSLRGPWAKTWKEYTIEGEEIVLTNGREVV